MEPVREAAEVWWRKPEGIHGFEVRQPLLFMVLSEKCDIVVLETGMGGLLDAKCNSAPLLCVFASISMDHMAFLGDTLEEIAAQKAGIIKSGSRVVSCRQLPEAMGVIEEACKEKGCELFVSDMESAKNVKYGLEKQRFSYKGHKNLEITMAGIHQIDNCALAVEALDRLADLGFPVKEEKLKAGLLRAKWPGRFEIIGRKPLFIADGAHNEDGAVKLAQSIRFYFTNRRIIYIMGILKDKEVDKIILNTCDYADAIITVAAPGNPRAMSSCELAEVVRRVHENVTAADSPEEAVEMARLLAGKEDVIIAFGSLSFLGDIIRIAEKRQQ
ncbi:MAG: bifunctional folylpolyglutamate synthase/dihydrofolate synthase [Eisenbergiella massiliensis]